MTEVVVVLQQSPSHFPLASSSSSSSSSSTTPCAQNDDQNPSAHITKTQIVEQEEEEEEETRKERERENQGDQVSVVELLLAAFGRSLIGPCTATERGNFSSSSSRIMQIGWPSNVRHIAHVTFDRFNGFLGLPVEFEPEVPRRPPSASANVFGVSTDSMQLSFDSRGNSVPTILLMMQRHLYAHGGLEAEGIFRINADNSQEEYVRDQLNSGVIPEGVDVHSLAGLIKAWFRELPMGLLDSISPEQVMESETEEECARLVRLLPPTEAALLDWTVNLMADVAQMEHLNKMNARNVAMVFAPNMTQMADPLTALMYAVQVMNFLKTLVLKTLRERADSALDTSPEPSPAGPTDNHDDSHESSSQTTRQSNINDDDDRETAAEQSSTTTTTTTTTNSISLSFLSSIENIIVLGKNHPCEEASPSPKAGQCSASSSLKRGSKKAGILGRINSRKELVEAWR